MIGVLVLAVAVLSIMFMNRIDISSSEATLVFIYDDKNITTNLDEEESVHITNMFNHKMLHNDHPSCGFTPDVSIRCGDLVFCIACDQCAIVQCGNQYFNISEKDREYINQLFEKYGGSFPCL